MSSPAASHITSVLKETPHVRARPPEPSRPPPHVKERGRTTNGCGRRAKGRPRGLLGRGQAEALQWHRRWEPGSSSGTSRNAQWFAGGTAQRQRPTASIGTIAGPRRHATRPPSSGRASPATGRVLDLPGTAPRGVQVRQRAQGPSASRRGDRRHAVHADGPRTGSSPCWPAPASAPRNQRRLSAASAPTPVADRNKRPPGRNCSSTADGRLAPGQGRPAQAETSTRALAKSPTVEEVRRLQPLQPAGGT